jgi:hypothetical protein
VWRRQLLAVVQLPPPRGGRGLRDGNPWYEVLLRVRLDLLYTLHPSILGLGHWNDESRARRRASAACRGRRRRRVGGNRAEEHDGMWTVDQWINGPDHIAGWVMSEPLDRSRAVQIRNCVPFHSG